MKRQIQDYLWVGDDDECELAKRTGVFTIHAAKTCHQKFLGYKGSLPKDHPNYLWVEDGKQLYLNIVDPKIPLFMLETFHKTIEFVGKNPGAVLIHCNEGFSRAPSLALVVLAHFGEISNVSFGEAYADYILRDKLYKPGAGIKTYLAQHWQEITGEIK